MLAKKEFLVLPGALWTLPGALHTLHRARCSTNAIFFKVVLRTAVPTVGFEHALLLAVDAAVVLDVLLVVLWSPGVERVK